MGDLYYVGDTVNLAFAMETETSMKLGSSPAVLIASGQQPTITSIRVSVYSDEGEIVHDDPVKIMNNTVHYTISPELTRHAGDYSAFFNIDFDGQQKHTYKILFSILPRNIDRTNKTKSSKLNEDSTELEVYESLGSDIRNMRRAGKNADRAYEIAQENVGRRLQK